VPFDWSGLDDDEPSSRFDWSGIDDKEPAGFDWSGLEDTQTSATVAAKPQSFDWSGLEDTPKPEAPGGVGAFLGRAATSAGNAIANTANSALDFMKAPKLGAFDPVADNMPLRPDDNRVEKLEAAPDSLGPVARTAADIVGGFAGEVPAIVAGGAVTKPISLIPKVGKILQPAAQFAGAGALAQDEGATAHGVIANAGMGGLGILARPLTSKIANPVLSNVSERLAAGGIFSGVQATSDVVRDGEVDPVSAGTAGLIGATFHQPKNKLDLFKKRVAEPELTATVAPNKDQVAGVNAASVATQAMDKPKPQSLEEIVKRLDDDIEYSEREAIDDADFLLSEGKAPSELEELIHNFRRERQDNREIFGERGDDVHERAAVDAIYRLAKPQVDKSLTATATTSGIRPEFVALLSKFRNGTEAERTAAWNKMSATFDKGEQDAFNQARKVMRGEATPDSLDKYIKQVAAPAQPALEGEAIHSSGGGGQKPPMPVKPPVLDPEAAAADTKYAGSINKNRVAGDDMDQRGLLDAEYEANKTAIDAQRNLRSNEAVDEKAANKLYTDEQIANMKPDAWREKARTIRNQMKAALVNYGNDPSPENKKRFRDSFKQDSGVASESGGTLQVYAQEAMSWENSLPPKERAILNIQKFYGDDDIPDSILKNLRGAKSDDEAAAADAVRRAANLKAGPKGWFDAGRYANMLSGAITHLQNLTTGAGQTGKDMAVRPTAITFDKLAPGKSSMSYREVPASYAGYITGAGEGARRALFLLQHGLSKHEAKAMNPEKLHAEMPGGLKNPFNIPGRALGAVDEFWMAVNEGAEKSAVATRKAWEEATKQGLKGKELSKRIPELAKKYLDADDVIEAGEEHAKRQVMREQMPEFMEKTSTWLRKPEKMVGGLTNPAGWVMPFIRVPFNDAAQKYARNSPLGFVNLVRNQDLHGNARTRPEKARLAAEATLGSIALASFSDYVMSGNVTGPLPEDPGERDRFYALGKPANSFKVGDRWLPLSMLGPLGSPLITLQAAKDAWETKQQKPDKSFVGVFVGRIGKSLSDSTYLAGVNSLQQLIANPDARGEQFLANIASQLVPFSGAQRSYNKSQTDQNVPQADTIKERVIGGTVLSDSLPPKHNNLGQPQKRLGLFPLQKAQPDPVYSELDRLGINAPAPSREVRKGNQVVKLTPAERQEFQKAKAPVYDALKTVVQSPAYKNASDEAKEQIIKKIMDRMAGVAQKPVRAQFLQRAQQAQ
jgi:hypothetical protein